jgi:RNA polymerase sigma-70 factor (ECF subfamily)
MPKNNPRSSPLSRTILENHKRFLAYLTSRVESREAAEEILQSAYAKGLKREGALKDSEKVTAWFFRLLKNALTDYYRHKAAEKRALERLGTESAREQDQKDAELEKNVCQCVSRVMKSLKTEYAEVLQKAEVEDKSIKDLASQAGTTPTNMSVRLHRARASLKEKVLQACGACADHGCLNCTCKHGV